jgi:hypothetical protein
VIFLSADNWSIPFSNWKKKKEIQLEDFETYKTIEWIVSGAFEIFQLTLYRIVQPDQKEPS